MTAYLSAYAPEFKGSHGSRDAWVEARKARIVGRQNIEVTLSDIDVQIEGPVARVTLVQRYRTDTHTLRTTRRLQLRWSDGLWLIEDEDNR